MDATKKHTYDLDHEIVETMTEIIAKDNILHVEAACVLIELLGDVGFRKNTRLAVIERWPQLEHRISKEENRKPTAIRAIQALDIENSPMADQDMHLWKMANHIRNVLVMYR